MITESSKLEYNIKFRIKLLKTLKEEYNCTNEILSNSGYKNTVFTHNKNKVFYINE